MIHRRFIRTARRPLLGLALLATSQLAFAQTAARTPDLSGKTDASIREVLRIVARHQLKQFGPLRLLLPNA